MLSQIKKSENLYTLDGIQFKTVFCYGIKQLSLNRDMVNYSNILPVPNGDTGDNIQKTLFAALSEMGDDREIGSQTAQCARGAMTGAHGSSGIILANFLIGFAGAMQDKDAASSADIISGINKGRLKASAEMPCHMTGTIFDMFHTIDHKLSGSQIKDQTLSDIMTTIRAAALYALKESAGRSQILAKTGLSDAGAAGVFYFIEGIYRYAMNEPLRRAKQELLSFDIPDDILAKGALYTVEFLINNVTLPVHEIKKSLSDMGDPVLTACENGDTVKVLIRTTDPRKVFDRSARFGRSTMIRVKDLIDEQRHFLSKIHNKPR